MAEEDGIVNIGLGATGAFAGFDFWDWNYSLSVEPGLDVTLEIEAASSYLDVARPSALRSPRG